MAFEDVDFSFRDKPKGQWSLRDVFNYQKYRKELEQLDLPSKQEFGDIMHDDDIDVNLKLATAQRVREAGGYDLLGD